MPETGPSAQSQLGETTSPSDAAPAGARPILRARPGRINVDAKDGQNRTLSIAQRHENDEAIAFQLMSALLDADSIREWHWIPEAAQTIYRFLEHRIPTADVFHEHIEGIAQLPEPVKGIATSPEFTDELNRLREHYTLHVIYTPHRNGDRFVRDDVLKVSWLERSIPASSRWLGSLATRMLPRPAPYEIAPPLLNSSKRAGTHIRILAPEEMQIGGIAISFGEHELPLLPSQPHRNTSGSTPEPAEPEMRIITDDTPVAAPTFGDDVYRHPARARHHG